MKSQNFRSFLFSLQFKTLKLSDLGGIPDDEMSKDLEVATEEADITSPRTRFSIPNNSIRKRIIIHSEFKLNILNEFKFGNFHFFNSIHRNEISRREFDRYFRNDEVDYVQEKRRARNRYRRSHVPYRGKQLDFIYG